MKIVNLTPHPVTICNGNGLSITIDRCDSPPRLEEETEVVGTVCAEGVDVPVIRKRFGKPQGLPEFRPGHVYVVSALLAQALGPTPEDAGYLVVIPAALIRDENGRILGARALAVV